MINFSAKSWLEQYLALRQREMLRPLPLPPLPEEMKAGKQKRFESLRHPFYPLLQQSGIAYGFPVQYPFQASRRALAKLHRSDLAKLILLDTMLYSNLIREGFPQGKAYRQSVARFGRMLKRYYQQLHQSAYQAQANFVEEILFQRVQYRKNQFDFRRSGINSHLFWDIYYFRRYAAAVNDGAAPPSDGWFEDMLQEKKEMKVLTLKLIAVCVHADWRIKRQERFLLRQFKASSKLLSRSDKKAIESLFRMGIALEDLRLPQHLSWMGRRYLMDVALLAVYADADIDLQEDSLLKGLAFRLKLNDDELMSSKASLGAFLYQYGDGLHFYKASKAGLLLIGQAIYENMAKLGQAARMEAIETRDMAATFGRLLQHRLSRRKNSQELPSEAEIMAAFQQLKDLPRFLPFFSFIFMPVPGITEMYILMALSLEKLSHGQISLLPSQLRRIVGHSEEEEE